MAYKKLSEATLVESVAEETNVLVEENDEIKRVPASMFGQQSEDKKNTYRSSCLC